MNLYIAYFDNDALKWVLNDNHFILSSMVTTDNKTIGQFTTDLWFSKLLNDKKCSHFIVYSMLPRDKKKVENLFNVINSRYTFPTVSTLQESEFIKYIWHFTFDISTKNFTKYQIMKSTFNNNINTVDQSEMKPSLYNNSDPYELELYFKTRLLHEETLKEYDIQNNSNNQNKLQGPFKLYISHPTVRFNTPLLHELRQ